MRSVSVIIPVYNVEKYIRECIESVLSQSFTDYEVICVNDASTDQSIEILKEYMKKSDKIRLVEHEKNRGLSAARNTGIRMAEGEYLIFVDSDDMLMPEALEELFVCAKQNNTDIIYYNLTRKWEGTLSELTGYKEPQYQEYHGVYNGQELFAAFAEDGTYKIEACRQLYRKEFLCQNDLWFYEGILHEDNLFSFLCAMKAERVMNVNKNYYIYRKHENSIMSTISFLRAESMFVVLMEVFTFWNSHEFTPKMNGVIKKYFESVYQSYLTYRAWGNATDGKTRVGSAATSCLYSLLYHKKNQQYVTLPEDKLKEIKIAIENKKQVLVYGAGSAAEEIVWQLNDNNIGIVGIAVSSAKVNPETFCGINVKEIAEYSDATEDYLVIIAITGKHRGGVAEKLKKEGFVYIIEAEDIIPNVAVDK